MLNLDDISEEEAISIEEDSDKNCNHEFLDHLYYTLCGSTSKNNMYTTLFDTFDKRMKELDRWVNKSLRKSFDIYWKDCHGGH